MDQDSQAAVLDSTQPVVDATRYYYSRILGRACFKIFSELRAIKPYLHIITTDDVTAVAETTW